MNIVITGANGFIGAALCVALAQKGHAVIALVRNPDRAEGSLPSSIRLVAWDSAKPGDWRDAIAAADVVVHLAGAPIGGRRWTAECKKTLRDSRIDTTRAVVQAMRAGGRTDSTLISGSAVGYYGDGGDRIITEADGPGSDFLSGLCTEWESEARKAEDFGSRVVLLRTGIVLGDGGALDKMLTPFKFGVGGPLGSGRQWISWIHREDAAALIAWAAESAGSHDIKGPMNVTAPNPVTMREFASTLGRVMQRPAFLSVPGFALKLILGEFAEALLAGQRVMPAVAQENGFTWKYPTVEPALRAILE